MLGLGKGRTSAFSVSVVLTKPTLNYLKPLPVKVQPKQEYYTNISTKTQVIIRLTFF